MELILFGVVFAILGLFIHSNSREALRKTTIKSAPIKKPLKQDRLPIQATTSIKLIESRPEGMVSRKGLSRGIHTPTAI